MSDVSFRPVFLMAPTGRSGTNWIGHALTTLGPFKSPDPAIIPSEDFLLMSAQMLCSYSEKTAEQWRAWLSSEEIRRREWLLCSALGKGILSLMNGEDVGGRRLLFRTPDTTNIELIHRLFEDAFTLVVVRDGRDVVESLVAEAGQGLTDKGWDHKKLIDYWTEKVTSLLDCIDQDDNYDARRMLIKYEDCIANERCSFESILRHCEVDINDFQWDGLPYLPVYGSAFVNRGGGHFVWKQAKKPATFSPVGRWQGWSSELKDYFISVAGDAMRRLGYHSS